MLRVVIVRGVSTHHASPNYRACMAILEHCRIGVDLKIDTAEMMKLTKGNRSPSEGFVILFPDEKYMTTDFFGLVQWIENNGLKPI